MLSQLQLTLNIVKISVTLNINIKTLKHVVSFCCYLDRAKLVIIIVEVNGEGNVDRHGKKDDDG